ncbi:hypothetical protein [Pediococcus pentosaceus]|uniref:hypothetical protein n=1 Tax=Pediococcus pentosaceus TaxID=1255 RepID=UPI0018A14040|nr:hypothetical protein [Pediococcus pentosaceus]MBF7103454.1 hypothetical protein [Pediococcus pentosaceus]
MAESNPTQVILTDDGIKIIKAQDTADNAASGVDNLNNPNLMSVIEKQNNIAQFAGLTSQYNVLVQNAKDDGIDTTAVTTAYNNLNQFMADILADPNHASDVDRVTYKKYQDAYNEELSKLQNALQNNTNNKFTSAASAASQAASTASQAFSQANSAIGVANGATTEITKLSGDINLRVTKDGLIDQINIQAGNTLISSSGQLTLSGKTIYFDTVNPVIIPSANIDSLLVGKKLTAADIAANTFSTNNGTFTVDKNGAITAKDMTLIGGTLTSPTINASTINGSTINGTTINTPNLNLGDNGQITGSYSVHDDIGWFQPINGTGSLKIANGYIQSTAHIVYYNKILKGIGGDKWGHWASSTQFVPAPNQAYPDIGNVAQSTLTPAFLKLDILSDDKSSVNSRVYIDGTGLYINDGNGSQAISSMLSNYELVSSGMAYLNGGIQMKQEALLTFGNLAMTGYHTIAMLDGKALYFTNKAGGGGRPIEIVAKTFTKSSRLSIKHDITPLSTAESSRLLNAIDVEKFRYTNDNATYKYQYGGVIDDVNSPDSKQYSMPPELLNEDGTGINLDSLTGILIKRVQDQDKTIGELSMRLTRLETEK